MHDVRIQTVKTDFSSQSKLHTDVGHGLGLREALWYGKITSETTIVY